MNAIAVSVVIPTYRRPDLLRRCLAALLRQRYPADAYEIVVADDGPDAASAALVAEMAGRDGSPSMRYVPVTATQGPAGARNAGWRAARGAVVAFTDDDTIPDPDWIAQGVQACAAADAATGQVVVPLPERPTDHERDTGGLARAEFVTANCFVRREALAAVGGFDERYRLAWREDSDLQFSLLEAGKRIAHAPQAVVVHPVREAPWGMSLRAQRKVFFDALLYRKFPRLYRRRIRPTPPWHYYVIVGALLIAAGAQVADRPGIAVAALLVWFAFTARFCLARLRDASLHPRHVLEMIVTSIAIPPLSVFWRTRGALHFRVAFF